MRVLYQFYLYQPQTLKLTNQSWVGLNLINHAWYDFLIFFNFNFFFFLLGFLWHKWERKSNCQKEKKEYRGVSKHQHRVNLSTQLDYTPNNIMHFLGTWVTPSRLLRLVFSTTKLLLVKFLDILDLAWGGEPWHCHTLILFQWSPYHNQFSHSPILLPSLALFHLKLLKLFWRVVEFQPDYHVGSH